LKRKKVRQCRPGTYDNSAKRPGGPKIVLDYDPLDRPEDMQRFLHDLISWTLSGRIRARQASVCRSIVATQIELVEGYREMVQHIEDINQTLKDCQQLKERLTNEEGATVEHQNT
jgi:hypothetical protein